MLIGRANKKNKFLSLEVEFNKTKGRNSYVNTKEIPFVRRYNLNKKCTFH